jgi:hypothetical protein
VKSRDPAQGLPKMRGLLPEYGGSDFLGKTQKVLSPGFCSVFPIKLLPECRLTIVFLLDDEKVSCVPGLLLFSSSPG